MRNFNRFLIGIWSILIVSCKNTDDKLPISKDKLYSVLGDIHLAEATIENENQVMKDSLSKLYYAQIFEHNGITRKDFDSCMSVMSDNPYLMNKVYKKVLDDIAKHDKSAVSTSGDSTKKVQ
jgi:Domain of unknown function (DUF4296)